MLQWTDPIVEWYSVNFVVGRVTHEHQAPGRVVVDTTYVRSLRVKHHDPIVVFVDSFDESILDDKEQGIAVINPTLAEGIWSETPRTGARVGAFLVMADLRTHFGSFDTFVDILASETIFHQTIALVARAGDSTRTAGEATLGTSSSLAIDFLAEHAFVRPVFALFLVVAGLIHRYALTTVTSEFVRGTGCGDGKRYQSSKL